MEDFRIFKNIIATIIIGLTIAGFAHAESRSAEKRVLGSIKEHEFEGHLIAKFNWPAEPKEYQTMKLEWESNLESYLTKELRLSKKKFLQLQNAKELKAKKLKALWGPLEARIEKKFGKDFQILPSDEYAEKRDQIEKEYDQAVPKILGSKVYPKYVAFRDKHRSIYFDRLQKKYGMYTAAFFVE